MSWLSNWGTSKSSQTTDQTTNPWAPAQPVLKGVLDNVGNIDPNLTGAEGGALSVLQGLADKGNPYAAGIGNYATEALTGGPDRTGIAGNSYDAYIKSLQPTINGDYLDPNKNPFFANTANTISNDVQNRVNAMYAGAGRDPAGAGSYGYTLGRGVSEGLAPVYGSIYNNERTNQLNAAGSAYGAGNSTAGLLSGLDTQRFANMGQGVNAANSALTAQNAPAMQTLAIEAQRRGIPLSLLQQISGIATPIAGLGGTTHGTASGTQTASGMQQFLGLTEGLKNISSMFSSGANGATGGGTNIANAASNGIKWMGQL